MTATKQPRRRHISRKPVYEFYIDHTPTLNGIVVTGERCAFDSMRKIERSEAVNLVHATFGVGTWLENLQRAARKEGLEVKGTTLRAIEVKQ